MAITISAASNATKLRRLIEPPRFNYAPTLGAIPRAYAGTCNHVRGIFRAGSTALRHTPPNPPITAHMGGMWGGWLGVVVVFLIWAMIIGMISHKMDN
jgi:hypothetical protein